MLAYSSTDESCRLASDLLPRLFQNQLLQFSLPDTMPLSPTSIRNLVSQIAPETPGNCSFSRISNLGTRRLTVPSDLVDRLISHILSLHMLLRITINLIVPHGEEMAILYVGLESGQDDCINAIEAAKRFRDDLIWPGNFVRVIHVRKNWLEFFPGEHLITSASELGVAVGTSKHRAAILPSSRPARECQTDVHPNIGLFPEAGGDPCTRYRSSAWR